MGEENLVPPIQEGLSVVARTGAAKPANFSKVIVDTTVQEEAIAFPWAPRLMHRARGRLMRLAKGHGVSLRQSYERIGKYARIAYQRYAHAKQFKRANKASRKVRTSLGRVERDIARKISNSEPLRDIFRRPLWLAERVREQHQKRRGGKVYSQHAPEVECIDKGKAHKPYESGVKARSPRRCIAHWAASSSPMGRRRPAILMTATRSASSSPRWRNRSALR
jgi:transposase, IS5 family